MVTLTRTHDPERCSGAFCVIHNPSEHHMRDWHLTFRADKDFLAERHCQHGCGHPDPDSLAHFIKIGQIYMAVHGCDGCCIEQEREMTT